MSTTTDSFAAIVANMRHRAKSVKGLAASKINHWANEIEALAKDLPIEGGYIYRSIVGASVTSWRLQTDARLPPVLPAGCVNHEFRRIYLGPIINPKIVECECVVPGCTQTDGQPCAYAKCPWRSPPSTYSTGEPSCG